MFDTIKNVRNSIEEIFNAKKYSLEKNDENIILILKISLFEKLIDVSLFLKKKEIEQTKLIDIMRQQINDLKREIKELKNKYNEDIEKLNNEIINLKNTNKKILKLIEEKDKFTFCFKNGLNYTLSKNGKIAEKTNGGNNWNCSIIGDTQIPKHKLSKWKIRLNKFEITNNTINICLGIGLDNSYDGERFFMYCWLLSCGESQLMLKTGTRTSYNNSSGKLKEGDII